MIATKTMTMIIATLVAVEAPDSLSVSVFDDWVFVFSVIVEVVLPSELVRVVFEIVSEVVSTDVVSVVSNVSENVAEVVFEVVAVVSEVVFEVQQGLYGPKNLTMPHENKETKPNHSASSRKECGQCRMDIQLLFVCKCHI